MWRGRCAQDGEEAGAQRGSLLLDLQATYGRLPKMRFVSLGVTYAGGTFLRTELQLRSSRRDPPHRQEGRTEPGPRILGLPWGAGDWLQPV